MLMVAVRPDGAAGLVPSVVVALSMTSVGFELAPLSQVEMLPGLAGRIDKVELGVRDSNPHEPDRCQRLPRIGAPS